ncbi:MAG TPA: molybdopterin-dependent oxidoreductase [Acidimicrobiales bacterium]|nr:molybdopterin-dependent oxidoreductase [Acidimicrobiales bacterium]
MLLARQGRQGADLARRPGGFGLGQVPARLAPESVVSLVCGFCSVGCSLDVHLRHGRAVNLTPTTDYPVNRGMACPKGWEALAPLAAPDRATTPLLRDGGGHLRPVGWPAALDAFVTRMRAVQAEHGPASVAFLSTGQIPTEEMALLGALAKFGMGMVHGDGNTRQCMATAVVAYQQAFGFDAPPYTYADLEHSDVIVLVGANPCIAHPILWERVCRNPHDPEIVVVDPRTTETAAAATQHLALAPKSDLVLLYGLARALIERGALDRRFVDAHTRHFDAFAAHVAGYAPERVAEVTGLAPGALERLAATVAGGERVSFWWTMGVNQSHEGVLVAQAIINLALLTGNIGRPGTGANSITGQCNAMGSRLFSNTTNLFGGRDFADQAHRAEVAEVLGIDAGRIPHQRSWAYDQIVEGIATGDIRGLWVIATNSAHSWINHGDLHDLLGRLDFLVVQDLYATTETAERADLVLPAAGWGEKEGTFINSERRVGLLKRVSRAPGVALADFAIFKLVADAWGCGELFEEWSSPEAVFAILGRLSAGRPGDLSGIDGYAMVDDHQGIQWPFPAGATAVVGDERRLFAGGRFFHADGRARFCFGDPRPPREATSRRYPLVLLTGRGSSAQWHTETRTAKSALLRTLHPEGPYVEVNPADAGAAGIDEGQWVTVSSARGSMRARALITPAVGAGQLFVPMHDAQVNRLTHPSFDPSSRQPSYKHCAVALRPLEHWER